MLYFKTDKTLPTDYRWRTCSKYSHPFRVRQKVNCIH